LATTVRDPFSRILIKLPSTNEISVALMNCGVRKLSDAATFLG
jgi:hypothetical protein